MCSTQRHSQNPSWRKWRRTINSQVALLEIGQAVIADVQKIISGQAKCYDEGLHISSVERLKMLESYNYSDAFCEAIEACLVDILSCDNDSWDTPLDAFKEDLEKLKSLLENP